MTLHVCEGSLFLFIMLVKKMNAPPFAAVIYFLLCVKLVYRYTKTLEGLLPTRACEYALKDPQTCGKYVKTLMIMQVRTVRI